MKILVTTDWFAPSVNGVVTSVTNLVDGLRKMGHDVRVLTLSQARRSRVSGGVYAIASVGIGRVYPGARIEYVYPRRFVAEIVRWKPDVVHSQCEFGTFPLARHIATACGAPLVHTYHTVYEDYAHYFCPNARLAKSLATRFSRRVLRRTDAVIAPTEKVGGMLRRYGVERTIRVVPSGFDLNRFQGVQDAPSRKTLRARLGVPSEARVLVYVGRLAKEKRVDELIRLFAHLGAKDAYLVLV